jgi:predicted kinase
MSKVYMLVGVPGSGKSTWYNSQDWVNDCVLVSTDKLIELEAARQGKTYNDVFKGYIDEATRIMKQDVLDAVAAGKDIIWDQTNTSKKSRKSKLAMVKDYYKIAVVFDTPAEEELKLRLANRPGKNIPWNVMQNMIDNFDMPSEKEGFEEIWRAA